MARTIWAQTDLEEEIQEQAVPVCASMHASAFAAVRAFVTRTGFHAVVTSADYMELLTQARDPPARPLVADRRPRSFPK